TDERHREQDIRFPNICHLIVVLQHCCKEVFICCCSSLSNSHCCGKHHFVGCILHHTAHIEHFPGNHLVLLLAIQWLNVIIVQNSSIQSSFKVFVNDNKV